MEKEAEEAGERELERAEEEERRSDRSHLFLFLFARFLPLRFSFAGYILPSPSFLSPLCTWIRRDSHL